MIEAIAQMEEDITSLRTEVGRISLQLSENSQWRFNARLARDKKKNQISELQGGILTLRKQEKEKKNKEKKERHEANQKTQRDRHSRMVSEFFKILDKDVFKSVADKVDNDG